jgi:transcription elongation factor Elf1
MSALNLICPHCRESHEDTWEVLDAGSIQDMRCESCGTAFAFAILECAHCAAEQVMTWPFTPNTQALGLLACEQCRRPIFHESTTEA